jgi:hypothetical protein
MMKGESFVVWLLASLLAIGFMGERPLLGLAIAVAGGVIAGVMLVVGDRRKRAGKR